MQALTITVRFLGGKAISSGALEIAYLLVGVTSSFPRSVVSWLQNCPTATKRELASALNFWKGWMVSEKTTPDLHRLCINWLAPFRAVATEFCLQTHSAHASRMGFFGLLDTSIHFKSWARASKEKWAPFLYAVLVFLSSPDFLKDFVESTYKDVKAYANALRADGTPRVKKDPHLASTYLENYESGSDGDRDRVHVQTFLLSAPSLHRHSVCKFASSMDAYPVPRDRALTSMVLEGSAVMECIVGSEFILAPAIQQKSADEYISNGDVVVDATISATDKKGKSNVAAIDASASLVIACVCRLNWGWTGSHLAQKPVESSVAYLTVQLSLPVVARLMGMDCIMYMGNQGVLTEEGKKICHTVINECTVLRLSGRDTSYTDSFGWLESLEGTCRFEQDSDAKGFEAYAVQAGAVYKYLTSFLSDLSGQARDQCLQRLWAKASDAHSTLAAAQSAAAAAAAAAAIRKTVGAAAASAAAGRPKPDAEAGAVEKMPKSGARKKAQIDSDSVGTTVVDAAVAQAPTKRLKGSGAAPGSIVAGDGAGAVAAGAGSGTRQGQPEPPTENATPKAPATLGKRARQSSDGSGAGVGGVRSETSPNSGVTDGAEAPAVGVEVKKGKRRSGTPISIEEQQDGAEVKEAPKVGEQGGERAAKRVRGPQSLARQNPAQSESGDSSNDDEMQLLRTENRRLSSDNAALREISSRLLRQQSKTNVMLVDALNEQKKCILKLVSDTRQGFESLKAELSSLRRLEPAVDEESATKDETDKASKKALTSAAETGGDGSVGSEKAPSETGTGADDKKEHTGAAEGAEGVQEAELQRQREFAGSRGGARARGPGRPTFFGGDDYEFEGYERSEGPRGGGDYRDYDHRDRQSMWAGGESSGGQGRGGFGYNHSDQDRDRQNPWSSRSGSSRDPRYSSWGGGWNSGGRGAWGEGSDESGGRGPWGGGNSGGRGGGRG